MVSHDPRDLGNSDLATLVLGVRPSMRGGGDHLVSTASCPRSMRSFHRFA